MFNGEIKNIIMITPLTWRYGKRPKDLEAPSPGFIHVREMSGKFNFFQGQGIVREFCDVSGKNEILQKWQGIFAF